MKVKLKEHFDWHQMQLSLVNWGYQLMFYRSNYDTNDTKVISADTINTFETLEIFKTGRGSNKSL